MMIPMTIMAAARRAGITAFKNFDEALAKKQEASVNINGNRPLHGAKVLVRIANSRSLGELMTRVPMTAAALQPNPMHIVRHCLPQHPAFLKR